MNGTLGIVLMIASPFLAAAVILAGLKGIEIFDKRRYQRAIDKRNALQELHGMKPFRGTKALNPKQMEEWLR